MPMLSTITLLAGALLLTPVGEVDTHDVRVDHARGAIEAQYRGRMVVRYTQIGTVAPGGRASTLRCAWRADVVVDRAARHPSGSTMARSITRADVASGSRPGWCDGQRTAIDREVAGRRDDLRRHLQAVAAEDHPTLTAEADQLHARSSAG